MTRALALLLCATGIGLVGFAAWSFLGEPGEIAPLGPETRALEGPPSDPAPAPSAPLDSLPFSAPPLSRPGGTTYPDRSTGPEGLMVVDPEGKPIPGAVVALCDGWHATGPGVRRRLTCDEAGVLPWDHYDPRFPIAMCVEADAAGWIVLEEKWGEARYVPTLALRRTTRVRVRLTDAQGNPLDSHRVELEAAGPLRPHSYYELERSIWPRVRTAFTDVRGLAVFRIEGTDPYFGHATGFTARTGTPATRSAATTMPYDPEGDVQITLVLPDGPAIRLVAVDAAGRRRNLDLDALYRIEAEEIIENHALLHRGEAVIPLPSAFQRVRAIPLYWIEDGISFTDAPLDDRFWQIPKSRRLELQSAPSIEVGLESSFPWEVPVVFADLPPVVSVAIHMPDGVSAARVSLQLEDVGGTIRGLRLDRQGLLHVIGGAARSLVLNPPTRQRCRFGATPLRIPACTEDCRLDPVTLAPPVIVAAGVVREVDDRPVIGARVVARAPHARRFEASTDEDGCFEILADRLLKSRITLEVWTREPPRHLAEEHDAGERHLVLLVPATGRLVGSLRTAPGPGAQPDIRLRVIHQGDGIVPTRWDGFREAGSRGHFRIESIPAGRIDLLVETPSGRSVMVRDIEIVAGATTSDPRLKNLDLSYDVTFLVVEVTSPDATPVTHSFATWSTLRGAGDHHLDEVEVDSVGLARIRLRPGPPGLLVVEGPRAELAAIYSPTSPVRVLLQPARACAILIPEALARAATTSDSRFTLQMTPHPPACPPELLQDLPSRDLRLDGQPTQTLDISPGRYRAVLLRRFGRPGRDTRSVEIGACTVDTETLRSGIRLAIDPAALADLLR